MAEVGCRTHEIPVRRLTYSPIPFIRAALWKYPEQIHVLTTSQSVPELSTLIFSILQISIS